MARYKLAVSMAGTPDRGAHAKYPVGTTIADTAGNAVAGDVVWSALTSVPNPNQLIPLDSLAATAIGGTIGVWAPRSSGVTFPGSAAGLDSESA